MKITHVISSIDTSTGGPARSVTHLVEGLLHKSDMNVSLHCKSSSDPIIKDFKDENGSIHFYPSDWLGGLNGLEEEISRQKPDLLHGHGLWQMPVHQMCNIAIKHNIPYIITPRGMLDEWSLAHKGFKKQVALWLYQKKDLNHAAVLHATSESEKKNIRKAGFKNPIAVIPNGITLPPSSDVSFSKRLKHVLFLSRLVPNKGIEELLEAWQQMKQPLEEKIILDIVGGGEQGYVKSIQKKIRAEYKSSVKFHGAVYGKEKEAFYKRAGLFVLPTYTENFGIVVAESLSYGLPVITTKGAPWQDLETHRAGWWIEIGTEPLKQSLDEALSLPASKLAEMGKNGRGMVEEKYSIESVAGKMKQLYRWILGKNEVPDFMEFSVESPSGILKSEI